MRAVSRNLTPSVRQMLEREKGFEPSTSSLARKCSTTELLPLASTGMALNIRPSPLLNGAEGQNRTDDTSIFSAVLYQLSYLGSAIMVGVQTHECQGLDLAGLPIAMRPVLL